MHTVVLMDHYTDEIRTLASRLTYLLPCRTFELINISSASFSSEVEMAHDEVGFMNSCFK